MTISPLPQLSSSGATGGTVATSGYTYSATSVTSPSDYDVSRELCGFFSNIFSAFDIFAQIINLVYFSPPLNISRVSFVKIGEKLDNDFPTDPLTQFITNLKNQQWYNDYLPYRKCTTHWHSIEFKVEQTRSFLQTTTETGIIVSDDPLSQSPTYNLNRKITTFGTEILTNTLDAIDKMYGILINKIRTADQIPI